MIIRETVSPTSTWQAVQENFHTWLGDRTPLLSPGLFPEPKLKVLIFLALLESKEPCTYAELNKIIKEKKVILGDIPSNSLRTSILSLGKTLDKFNHSLILKSFRGRFQLLPRNNSVLSNVKITDPVVLLLDPVIQVEKIAEILIEKAMLSLPGLYFLEWSARWWETYSSREAEARVNYESSAWERLGIRERIHSRGTGNNILNVIGLAPGEGVAEIGILKKIFQDCSHVQIHYFAIDTSQRLLRDHIGLLKETFTTEIESGRIVCAGIVGDIFSDLRDSMEKTRVEFRKKNSLLNGIEFLPLSSPLLITYLGNCLGNNQQDQETDFFTMIFNVFKNRPMEVLVGVSVMRDVPDKYIRDWDDFLLQTPRHLLETKKLLISSRIDDISFPEFTLPTDSTKIDRCPPVIPEKYIVRHSIEGQIYRFYYKLAYDLDISLPTSLASHSLPKGSLILLHSIIKYKMETLINGIKKSGLFKTIYDPTYHQVVDTSNGKREYAVFSAYID